MSEMPKLKELGHQAWQEDRAFYFRTSKEVIIKGRAQVTSKKRSQKYQETKEFKNARL